MIKYVELTAPEANAYRQAKIVQIVCQEGDHVNEGDTLFLVKSGDTKIALPATKTGRVVEIIASQGENITLSSALILLETEVGESTATHPVNGGGPANKTQQHTLSAKPNQARQPKHLEQQSLNLQAGLISSADEVTDTGASASQQTSSQTQPNKTETPAESPIMSDSPRIPVTVPDIGTDSAKVVEILVNIGDVVDKEDPLMILESDKASMEVPSSASGTIESIEVKLDQDVSEGTVIVTLVGVAANAADTRQDATTGQNVPAPKAAVSPPAEPPAPATQPANPQGAPAKPLGKSHASPSIRRFARELGVDLSQVTGSGRKQRVTREDVKSFVKGALSQSSAQGSGSSSSAGIPEVPTQDFSKFGDIEVQPLNKIKRLTAKNLHRSWLNVPLVTHHDESNISDLESFRKQLNQEYAKQKQDIKLSPLAFIVKAVVSALQTYPQFNSSLEAGGENLILKKYFHIGIAVDTPNGLVVPVIRNADHKSVAEIAQEMGELASKARDKKLTMNDMSGVCFTISSLGGIGGTSFTPLVNTPEVAILGVSRSKITPVWNGKEFEPGMMLPLSLSYDHRVIDGAEAARFTRHIAIMLEDIRRLAI